MSSRGEYHLQVYQVLAAGFIVCRFDLDKKFSELVGCLAFDSDSNLSHSTVTIALTMTAALSLSFLWETCES